MFNHKFTNNLKQVLRKAATEAHQEGDNRITTGHLLSALFKQQGSLAAKVLNYEKFKKIQSRLSANRQEKSKVNPEILRAAPRVLEGNNDFSLKDFTFSKTAREAIAKAVALSYKGRHYFTGTEHLLAALLEIKKGRAYFLLKKNNFNLDDLERHLAMLLDNASKFSQIIRPFEKRKKRIEKQGGDSFLDYFSVDLNEKARQGAIDPVIGRTREIQRIINILGRRTKNNPVLVGEAGVGKTAIAEGLAYKIVQGKVPPLLKNKRVVLLDLASLVAGTMFRGEFESRLKRIMEQLEADPNIILFIDELHTVIGSGAASGSLDTANILKPALARGRVRCIGATTLSEYQKYIEKDPALERRFQPVIIHEPNIKETIKILQGIKKNYEKYHQVEISDKAVETAVKLSVRYIADRLLPDKAIDLIDEAASREKIKSKEPRSLSRLHKLKDEFRKIEQEKQKMVAQENYARASILKDKEGKFLSQIERLEKKVQKSPLKPKGKITAEEIKKIVSEMTGIPCEDLQYGEKTKLLGLEKSLTSKVIGQEEAIKSIAQCIRRFKAGLGNPNRPLGSFIFLGPSGVGKTYLAQILAEEIFGSSKNLVRIDMSEFHETFNISRLVGAPAGYVGYEEGGRLTEKIRHQPYSVVLLDEIEKAHPDVLNILLQILEDGTLTDAQGRLVNFKNTIVIMTSNIGSRELAQMRDWGFSEPKKSPSEASLEVKYQDLKKEILKEIEEKFRPEFLNRVDKIIILRSLGLKELTQIAKLIISELTQRLAGQNISLTLEPQAARFLAQKAFDPFRGARPLRRLVSEWVEDPLASMLLAGEVQKGEQIKITVQKKQLKLTKE